MLAQSILLEFVRAVDPYGGASGTEITASNIHSQDGEKWTAQQRLDIYNQARFALLTALHALPKVLMLQLSGALVVNKTDWQWTLSGSTSTAAKPTGFIEFISAETNGGVPMILLDQTLISVVLKGDNPNYVQSASNIHIFEVGGNFIHFGTYVTSASNYKLQYVGLSRFTLTDVTTATAAQETFNDIYYPALVDIATQIANGATRDEAVQWAAKRYIKA